jgi:hypothetical protein
MTENNVLVFEGNLNLNKEQMREFLISERIGHLLRMDDFSTPNNDYKYNVYFEKIFDNSFTDHLFRYLNSNVSKYEMTFIWKNTNKFFYVYLYSNEDEKKRTIRSYDDYIKGCHINDISEVGKCYETILSIDNITLNKIKKLINSDIKYQKIQKNNNTHCLKINPAEIIVNELAYNKIMDNLDKDEDEEWIY